MSEKLTPEELEKKQAEMLHKRKIRNMILAYMDRGKNAGIPPKYLRINKEDFKKLLLPEFYSSVNDFADFIYGRPEEVMKIPYIVIDGGTFEARKKAGFAILFRLITCDHFGHYQACGELASRLNSFDPIGVVEGNSRADIVDDLKMRQVLFLGEFHRTSFREKCEGGNFFDIILGHRSDNLRPTILSFTEIISQETEIRNLICGQCLANLTHRKYAQPKAYSTPPPIGQKYQYSVLRIRLKK